MATHSFRFPGETEPYRHTRNQLLQAEVGLRRRVEEVAALRRQLPGEPLLRSQQNWPK